MDLFNYLCTYIPVFIVAILGTGICDRISKKELANYFDLSDKKIENKINISFIIACVLFLAIFKGLNNFMFIVPLFSVFVSHFIIDIKSHELPDKLNLLIAIFAIVKLIVMGVETGFSQGYITFASSCLTTSAVMFIVYLVLACITGGALGGGDIKLVTALGLFLPKAYLFKFLLFPFIIGAIISTYLLIFKKAKKEDVFPFGPSILISFLVVVMI